MRLFSFVLGFSVFALDILTKWFVKKNLWLHYYPVVEGFFTIKYVQNEGIAFGLFHNLESSWKPLLLSAIAVVAILIVAYYILTTPMDEKLTFVALGLLLGGILGNLVDRMIHKHVVDFLTLHWYSYFAWPTFNVADAAITSGVFLILFQTFRVGRQTAGVASVLLLPLFIWQGTGAWAQDLPASPDQVIERLQAKYESIQSFEARFRQTFSSRGVEMTESGIVMMKQPGMMYWEYQEPVQKFFVADGKKTYFYVPRDNQVLVTEFDLTRQDSPLLFLLGKGNLQRDFYASIEREADPASEGGSVQAQDRLVVRLTPRTPHPEFTHLLLQLDPETDLIRKLTVVEPIGQQNEYLLTDFQANVKIPGQKFKLNIPPHVEVIEQ